MKCACGAEMDRESRRCRACYLAAASGPQGTVSRYVNRRCRCPKCRDANTRYRRAKREIWERTLRERIHEAALQSVLENPDPSELARLL